MEIERKPVPNFPSYFASTDGTIWKFKAGIFKPLKPGVNTARKGYLQVVPWKDGKGWTMTIHRVMMMTFVGEKPEGCEIMHLDGDKTNNALSNLKYGTPAENNQDKKRHGTHLQGERCHTAKVKEAEVMEIRRLAATGLYSQSFIGEMFGLTQTPISLIVRGKTWSHVGNEVMQ